MSAQNNGKVGKKKKFDVGIAIFIGIFIYIFISIILSAKSESITGYQVKNGMLSENRIYNGIALRKENVVNSDYSGYLYYFIREGERAGYNNLIFCIDETGKLSDLIGKKPTEDNSLTETELTSVRHELQLFSKTFSETYFPESVTFENKINNELAQIENRRIIEDVSSITSTHLNDVIDYCRAKASGIVLFYEDGYEDFIASDLTLEDFKKENYSKKVILNDDLVEAGSFAYKYVSDENWSIVICVPNSDLMRITDSDYVLVKFSKTLTTSYGKVNLINTYDEYSLIELSFTNSMITFAPDRFVEVELLLEDDTGLKIPNSAIAEKAFYLIDKDYVTLGGNSSNYTVLRREFGENGETVKAVEIEIVKEEETEYYVDTLSLNYGDVLIMPEKAVKTQENNTFVVGKQGTLIGVYNINKGYADFKRIEILYSNDEYSIIKPSSAYGLRAYDYIALDATVVTDKDFVY